MNTIEQAAKRLEELRRAGVDIPDISTSSAQSASATPSSPVQVTGESTPVVAQTKQSRPVELDVSTMRQAGLLTPGEPRSRLEDEFRIITCCAVAAASGARRRNDSSTSFPEGSTNHIFIRS